MIYLRMVIDNPWFNPRTDFESKDYYWKDTKLTKNKNFEIQISRFEPTSILDVGIDLRWRGQDHRGPELDLNILGFMFNVKIYDSRHWNHEKSRWYTDEEAMLAAEELDKVRVMEKGA